jgi:hypothetical protein
MFERVPDDRLRAYLIWQPILNSDNRISAERRANEFVHEKLTHYWDSNKATGDLWKDVLRLKDTAWDVYLLYNGAADWSTALPSPDLWFPQLHHATRARFEVKTKQLLKEIP